MSCYQEIPDFLKKGPEIDLPFPGARGWLVQGRVRQVVFVEFDQDITVPEHVHNEQWEFAIDGKVELHREGKVEIYTAGDNFFVPAGVPHGATIHAGYKAMIIFNSPDRYKEKTSA